MKVSIFQYLLLMGENLVHFISPKRTSAASLLIITPEGRKLQVCLFENGNFSWCLSTSYEKKIAGLSHGARY